MSQLSVTVFMKFIDEHEQERPSSEIGQRTSIRWTIRWTFYSHASSGMKKVPRLVSSQFTIDHSQSGTGLKFWHFCWVCLILSSSIYTGLYTYDLFRCFCNFLEYSKLLVLAVNRCLNFKNTSPSSKHTVGESYVQSRRCALLREKNLLCSCLIL